MIYDNYWLLMNKKRRLKSHTLMGVCVRWLTGNHRPYKSFICVDSWNLSNISIYIIEATRLSNCKTLYFPLQFIKDIEPYFFILRT